MTRRRNCNSSRHTCTNVTLVTHLQPHGLQSCAGSCPGTRLAWETGLDNFAWAAVGVWIRRIHNYIWFNFSQWWNWTKIPALRTLEKWGNLILNPFSVRQVFLKLLLKSLMFSHGIFFAGKSLRLPETRSHFFTAKQADNKLRALTKTVQNFLPCDALLDKRFKSCHSPLTEQLERKREPKWPVGN